MGNQRGTEQVYRLVGLPSAIRTAYNIVNIDQGSKPKCIMPVKSIQLGGIYDRSSALVAGEAR